MLWLDMSGVCTIFAVASSIWDEVLIMDNHSHVDNHSHDIQDIRQWLSEAGVSPTPNRLLVLRAIAQAHRPVSLAELEAVLETMEKSSIFRVLNLLESKSLIHTMQDGRGITKYELCRCQGHGHSEEDMHVHFYCTNCRETFCFEDLAIPAVTVPDGFRIDTVNFMLQGLCPACSGRTG